MERGRLPCLVLTSGGLDSTACLGYYLHRKHPVTALFVDYQHPARLMEGRAVRSICAWFGVELQCVQLAGEEIPTNVVRGRNGLLLSVGLMMAPFAVGLVGIGLHTGTSYTDCSPLFLRAAQSTYDVYSQGRLRIDAPFLAWSKRDIYDFATSHGIPTTLTYSCLRGAQEPCGICESCRDIEAISVS